MKNTTRGESQKNNKMKDTSEWISWEDNEIIRMEKKLLTQSGFGGTDKAIVRGKIDSEFVYSHKIQDEKFYRTIVRTKRLSGTDDFIPIIVSETLIEPKMRKNSLKGKFVQVLGRFKSHNEHFGTGHCHLDIYLFAKAINIYDNETEMNGDTDVDLVYFEGYVCKPPVFRVTSLHKREITDLFIAVNDYYGKSYYFPCIAWGKNAKDVKSLEVGDHVRLYGRVQSRLYSKKVAEDSEDRVLLETYEVSIVIIEKIDDVK